VSKNTNRQKPKTSVTVFFFISIIFCVLIEKMDKNIFGDIDNLPEEDKQRMSTMVKQLQTRDRYVSNFDFFFIL
jgi:hypothetical protein